MIDRPTIEIYEGAAEHYRDARGGDPVAAAAFAEPLPKGTIRLDLGCGPGLDLEGLGRPTVALDAAMPMLRLVAPDAWRVQADVAALPFRRGAAGAAWSSKCHQHLRHEQLPLALAELHRVLAVGAPLSLRVFHAAGSPEPGSRSDDDLPGRWFSWWAPDRLTDVVVGAGFDIDDVVVGDAGEQGVGLLTVRATRARTLADTVGPGMRLLFCGLNPSIYAADAGLGFARPGNRFWPAAREAGVVTVDRDPVAALVRDGVGMTDLVKRASVGADEVGREEYERGMGRLERLSAWLRPAALCFVGLAGWRALVDRRSAPGWQEATVGGCPAYLAPSTSGRNASSQIDDLIAHFRAALRPPTG